MMDDERIGDANFSALVDEQIAHITEAHAAGVPLKEIEATLRRITDEMGGGVFAKATDLAILGFRLQRARVAN